jgi:lipopolysaccharide export LptBFGC system permease protein LptF
MTAKCTETFSATGAVLGERRISLAPFGWYTRYMLRCYVQHVCLVALVLLIIGWTLDLSPRLSQILGSDPQITGIAALLRLCWYMIARGADIMAELWPMACFLGVLWSEVAYTMSRERLIISNSGRSPAQCLMPLLLFGMLAGTVQVALVIYLRPAAVLTQVTHQLGVYGERFNRGPANNLQWISAGHDLIQAQITYGLPLLRHVTVYRLGHNGQLQEIIRAESARPSGDHNWIFYRGSAWKSDTANLADGAMTLPGMSNPSGEEIEFDQRPIALSLHPVWLSNRAIDAKYLSHEVLQIIVNANIEPNPSSAYRAWLVLPYMQAFLPGASAALAAALAHVFLIGIALRADLLFGLTLAGYASHAMTKILVVLGEKGHISPILAGGLVPVLLIAVAAIIYISQLGRLRGFSQAPDRRPRRFHIGLVKVLSLPGRPWRIPWRPDVEGRAAPGPSV